MATSMMRLRIIPKSVRIFPCRQERQQHSLSTEEFYDEAHYPPVKPRYPPGQWGIMEPRIAWTWEGQRQKLAELGTAEKKMKLLTEKTFQVWKYYSVDRTPNLLEYQCQVTKSNVVTALPELYDDIVLDDELYHNLKQDVIETIIHEYEIQRKRFTNKVRQIDKNTGRREKNTKEYNLSKLVVRNVIMNLFATLCGQRQDISECRIDSDARVSAFWSRNGFLRKKLKIPPKDKNFTRQNNTMFYSEHTVDFQVRKSKPLPEFVSTSEEVCQMPEKNNKAPYSPQVLGQFMERIDRDVTAGYNLGDPQMYNHLSFILLNRDSLYYHNKRFGSEITAQAKTGYALNTGFLSTVAQAHCLGFNEYEELTYPITTQTVLTDGVDFILSAYQLNTLQLWKDNQANKQRNVCWVTEKQSLFKDYENDKLVDFNDELFQQLLKFMFIKSCDRDGINLTPYLKPVDDPAKIDIPERKVVKVETKKLVYDRS